MYPVERLLSSNRRDGYDELAQRVRIKLWLALEKRNITNHKAYIRSIVHSEVVDMIRSKKSMLSLPLDEDGELLHYRFLASSSEEFLDPACVVEEAETMSELLARTAVAVHALPPCQQRAILCTLEDQVDDLALLTTVFREKQLEIGGLPWPVEKTESQRLRASLWVSRKKLRETLKLA